MTNFEKIYGLILEKVIDFTPRIISALVILVIGWYSIKLIKQFIKKRLEKKETDPTLITFLLEILVFALKILLFITVVSKLGVQSSTFVAIIGAASLAVGLALQGSLSNFAGGVLIIFLKPFKSGDLISAQGQTGVVDKILIFNTILISPENQTIYIPNGILSNGTIVNYTKNGIRKLNVNLSIERANEISKSIQIIENILYNHPLVLKEPAPKVFVKEVTEQSAIINIQTWCSNDNYNNLNAIILKEALEQFKANNII